MSTIALVQMADEQPTSYLPNGKTRTVEGAVPHLSQVRTVGSIGRGPRWRLSRGTAADLVGLQYALADLGVEPIRITDAWRPQDQQAELRRRFDLWKAAGEPVPNGPGWIAGMRNDYAAKPGESNHGWGGAMDIDVRALQMPDVPRGSNGALDAFWELAAQYGFTPIIAEPRVSQSESWHFDHLGPLRKVRELFLEVAQSDRSYRGQHAAQTALAGCALAGTLPKTSSMDPTVAYIQARLTLAGHFCGRIDGQMGPKTRGTLAALGIQSTSKTKPEALLPPLSELGLADELLEAA